MNHVGMITRQQDVEYLICTIGNFTSANLADHLDGVRHAALASSIDPTSHPLAIRHKGLLPAP